MSHWQIAFFCAYGRKSVLLILANLTVRKVGGSQEYGSDIELNCRLVIELASAATITAATWEHASPNPAMHVQFPQATSPSTVMTKPNF